MACPSTFGRGKKIPQAGRLGWRVAPVLFLVFVLSACETAQLAQITELKRVDDRARILLMPPDVELSSLTAGGLLEPNAEWSKAANGFIVPAIREEMQVAKVNVVEYAQPSQEAVDKDEHQITKLHNVIGFSIMRQQFAPALKMPTKEGKFDWSLGPKVQLLRKRFDADYALFVFVRDSYATSGRAAVMILGALLGVGVPGGAQVGFTSLVDLKTGNVVWFNPLARPTGDLRTAEPARETVKSLLANFPK